MPSRQAAIFKGWKWNTMKKNLFIVSVFLKIFKTQYVFYVFAKKIWGRFEFLNPPVYTGLHTQNGTVDPMRLCQRASRNVFICFARKNSTDLLRTLYNRFSTANVVVTTMVGRIEIDASFQNDAENECDTAKMPAGDSTRGPTAVSPSYSTVTTDGH